MYDKYRDEHAADATGAVDPTAMDVATLVRDDALLTALGRGDQMTDDDEVAVLLAAWRTDLLEDQPSPATPATPVPESSPRQRHGWARGGRTLIALAAAVAALAGATTFAAGNARPGSPLWPITTIVYGERADSRLAQQDAERAIRQARTAIADARYTEAVRLLDTSTALVGDVRDKDVARRLLDEIAAVRGLLPGGIGVMPSAAPTASPPASAAPAASRQPRGATPTPAASSGTVPLPSLPLPSLPPLPLPTPTLPKLPLPSLGPLLP